MYYIKVSSLRFHLCISMERTASDARQTKFRDSFFNLTFSKLNRSQTDLAQVINTAIEGQLTSSPWKALWLLRLCA